MINAVLTLGRTRNSYPHCGTRGVAGGAGGGGMEPLPAVFDMLQYFQTILPSVESLCSSQQDKVHFIGGGAARGL